MKGSALYFLFLMALFPNLLFGADGGINISVSDSNNTTVSITTSEASNTNVLADNGTDADAGPTVCKVPSVVEGVLTLPEVDIWDMEHGIWLKYEARVYFDGAGCVQDLDLTPLGLSDR